MPANSPEGQGSLGPTVSVIVPARNEEACLEECLSSLLNQHGVDFEVIVVNDGSTDRTREIAESFTYAAVEVIDADPLPPGWTGKSHAVHCGYQRSRGKWLLFTDADTVHRRGSLRHAVSEAQDYDVDMLSYSPKQNVEGFWERALMPVVFAELRREYPPSEVNNPASSIAAANGQYLLITREAYEAIGGHAAVRSSLLEDVALARLIKKSKRRIRFRYGGDAVKTRMYRSARQMWEGWTKNLALLFAHPLRLAFVRSVEFLVLSLGIALLVAAYIRSSWMLAAAGTVLNLPMAVVFFRRVRKAHFGWLNTIISPLGIPIFVLLLIRSQLHYKSNRVSWKGRQYAAGDQLAARRSEQTARVQ